jgi:hypothetical protein
MVKVASDVSGPTKPPVGARVWENSPRVNHRISLRLVWTSSGCFPTRVHRSDVPHLGSPSRYLVREGGVS